MSADIWRPMQSLLTETTGENIGRLAAKSVPGGDINQAWCLSDGQRKFFVKTNAHKYLPMFEAEMRGLDEIRRSCTVRVPRAIACGLQGEQAFIVMEHVELSGRVDPVRMAQQLAAMHLCTRDQFGFDMDNTIGLTPQINDFACDWVSFWQQRRLGYQLELARSNGYGSELYDAGMRLNEQIKQFFSGYRPRASLLHGDLWSGNQGADSVGIPIIYDPACYYGDHETDLAMMELFGSPGQLFFNTYNELFSIADGYSQRRDLYNLYHILNHANLFGGSYVSQAQRLITSLLRQV